MASTARIDELKKKFDDNPRRYFAPLANEFRKAGDIEQAILICEEFLPQQPGHMSGHIVYGQALYEAGRMPESRTVFETALSLDPENLIALRHLGDIARGQNDTAAARTWYARVLDADPRNDEIQGLIASLGDAEAPADVPASAAPSAPAEDPAVDQNAITEQRERSAPHAAAAAAAPLDFSLDDTMPAGMPAVPQQPDEPELMDFGPPPTPPAPEPAAQRNDSASYLDVPTEPMQAFSLEGLEATSADETHGAEMQRAEGLEPAEFTAPDEPVQSLDLDDSLDSGVPEFESPGSGIAPLDGLEDSGMASAPEANTTSDASLSALDEEDPLDITGGLIPSSDEAPQRASVSDFAMEPESAAEAAPSAAYQPESAPDIDLPEFEMESPAAPVDEAPAELPAAVLAAEAELIDAGETPAPEMPSDREVMAEIPLEEGAEAPVASAPFVTETMADLYLAQGFRDQALSVFRQLVDASPDDARLRARLAELSGGGLAPAGEDEGPSVRAFFARFANRRPGARAYEAAPPAADDFASFQETTDVPEAPVVEAVPDAVVEPAPEPMMALEQAFDDPAVEERVESVGEAPAAASDLAADQSPGTIDALFGNQPTTTSEDSAASALAQAFGNEPELPPVIAGRPARAAAGELSLDSVFRDGSARPPRSSQSFSFDQFFSEGATQPGEQPEARASETTMHTDAPAERSADDIEQFNSWLQGLKQK